MVKPLAQELVAHTIMDPLDVSECLAQGMGSVIPPEVNLLAPGFDKAVGVADCNRVLSFLASEKITIWIRVGVG